MNIKAFFPCGGGSNLILGTSSENEIFFLRTPADVNFFHKIVKKWHFGLTGGRHGGGGGGVGGVGDGVSDAMKRKIITHPDGFL